MQTTTRPVSTPSADHILRLAATAALGLALCTTAIGAADPASPTTISQGNAIAGGWNFECPAPVPPGWVQVTVQVPKDRKELGYNVVLATKTSPVFDTYARGVNGRNQLVFLAKSPHPIEGIRLLRTRAPESATSPVEFISIQTVAGDDGKTQAIIDLSVEANHAQIDGPIAPGMFRLNQLQAKPQALLWVGDGDSKFSTPADRLTSVYLETPLKGILLEQADGRKNMVLERVAEGTPFKSEVPEDFQLARTTDPANPERAVLVIEGETPTPPVFAELPLGKKVAVLTTWDDGPVQDLKLADLLAQHGFHATFFVVHRNPLNPPGSELEARGHEVGSHSWSHPMYSMISPSRCERESVEMRRYLEWTLGHPVVSFAYPYNVGKAYDKSGEYVARAVEKAGYWSGRNTFVAAKSVGTYENPASIPSDGHYKMGLPALEKAYAAALSRPGGVFYFWGHSYELDRNEPHSSWADLTQALESLGKRPEAWYATQGELFVWRWLKQNVRLEAVSGQTHAWTLTRPWLHPFLNKVPVSLNVGNATRVTLNGRAVPVSDGRVDLIW